MADRAFIRITNVTIPQGSTINKAWVRFTAYDSQVASGIDVNCYFVDADNPSAIGSVCLLGLMVLNTIPLI
jgi:hypothetical protein